MTVTPRSRETTHPSQSEWEVVAIFEPGTDEAAIRAWWDTQVAPARFPEVRIGPAADGAIRSTCRYGSCE